MEIFREVKGYEGYYEVSNLGNVRSTSYKGVRILRPSKTKCGYLDVVFCIKQKKEHKLIHRLVAEAFIDNPNNLSTVNHKDEDKLNNNVENLEWMSFDDNIRYSNNKMLTESQVLKIPAMIESGYSQMDIANSFGVSRRTIQFILQGEHWNNLGIDFTKLKCKRKKRNAPLLVQR
jgi:NUMOD4 motif/HNH endonuclease